MSPTLPSQARAWQRWPIATAVLAGALALSACARPAWVSPVDVTRFVGAAPAQLGQGTISITTASGSPLTEAELAPYRAAIAAELAAIGYQVVPSGGAQLAQLSLEQGVSRGDGRRSPVSVGGGASVGSYGSGVGLGIGLDLSGPPPERIDRRLSLAIRPATGGANLWEGRASMSATGNSEYAAPDAAAQRLASALLAGFPGHSGETVQVP